MNNWLFQDVPLTFIRHNDLHAYVVEGYGGRPIEEWPMYIFFGEYLSGKKEVAVAHFCEWYKEQLKKYHHTPKIEGGMYKGSLYTLIEKTSGKNFMDADSNSIDRAIHERVRQRFQLLDDIHIHGYDPRKTEPIHAIKKNNLLYLVRGHHRAAILRALGRETLPRVLVFPNQFIYNLVRFVRK